MHIQFLQPMNKRHLIFRGELLALLAMCVSPALVAQQSESPDSAPAAAVSVPASTDSTAVQEPQVIDPPAQETTSSDELETLDETAQDTAYGQLSEDGFLLDRLEARSAFWDFFDSEQYALAIDAGELVL